MANIVDFSQRNTSLSQIVKSSAHHELSLKYSAALKDSSPDTPYTTTNMYLHRNDSNSSPVVIVDPPCQWILYEDIGDSRVRIWDLIILIPNALFLVFLLLRLRSAIVKLRNSSSPIFLAFYGLVFLVAIISILRCIVAMTVNAAIPAGDYADKILWLILRFFLLATELSVVIFGLAFGHLDSRTSIRRVLLVTSFIALAYSCTQGLLEFLNPDPNYSTHTGTNSTENYSIFAHGGMIFWFSSSLFFCVIYSVICILPWTMLKEKFALPSKKSFYYYCLFLALLNFTQAVGSILIYRQVADGRCVVDVTTYIYFTLYDPLVYGTFLREFFSITQPSILFSYKHQVDDIGEEDTVSLPYQNRLNKAPDDPAFSSSYDSTHFDRQHSINDSPVGSVGIPSLSLNSDYYQDIA